MSCRTETPHPNTAEYRKKTVRIQLSSFCMNACELQKLELSETYSMKRILKKDGFFQVVKRTDRCFHLNRIRAI